MFGQRIELFNLFGFPVRVDASWLLLALLVVCSLAFGYFPNVHPGYVSSTYWLMSILSVIGLFASIVVHEFAHARVARAYGVPMSGITLFLFGGVSEMEQEAPNPRAEFWIALAGPISSMLIAAALMGITIYGQSAGWPESFTGVLFYLALLNALLIIFNMLPAFPLDGGRILRAILWKIRGNQLWASRITSRIGSGFGLLLALLGIINVFNGALLSGFWWVMIGLFLKRAAGQSYQQLLLRERLEGKPVHQCMTTDVVVVPPDITLNTLVRDYFYTSHHRDYPVVGQGRLLGHIPLSKMKTIPRDEWGKQRVRDVLEPVSAENAIAPLEDTLQALALLNKAEQSHLMVVEDDRLLGLLSLTDILKFLSVKTVLEEKAAGI